MKKNNLQRNEGKIESNKIFIQKVFTDFWFRVPDYQRSYVWGKDEITDLLDDIKYAYENHPDGEYFLGSLVLQKKSIIQNDIDFIEYDVLDGQQRLTTLMLILAVIRDQTNDDELKEACNSYIYQKEQKFRKIPERLRLVYEIRDDVGDFVDRFIKKKSGSLDLEDLKRHAETKNVSIANMSIALLFLAEHFSKMKNEEMQELAVYLFNNVLFIYVATEDLQDAFRLFTILNDRGIPLNNSDILKASNLGIISDKKLKRKYALKWEEIEGNFGRDEFDRLLSHIRTIIVKDKARENILKEFELKVYSAKPPLLTKGEDTIKLLTNYADIYDQIIWFNNLPGSIENDYKNLIIVMREGLPSTDWIPPLMAFYNKFKTQDLLDFLIKLDNKFTRDWIVQLSPTVRLQNMIEIIRKIEKYKNSSSVIDDADIFPTKTKRLIEYLSDDIYSKKFAKYILLKLEYLNKDHSSQFNKFDYISVEHILPQNPNASSKWMTLFSEIDHEELVHKMGNLVLLSRKKNSSLGNKDFEIKKDKYFSGNIDSFPNSLKVMRYDSWTKARILNRQEQLLEQLNEHYKI